MAHTIASALSAHSATGALGVARLQFAITTLYHFLFVPITIGLATLTAILQTAWYRTGSERYLRATRFWGGLFLINVAMGVVTGIVQEFQFGMNWSAYSRFVGDVFGAPLAMEALCAFFLESTFVGVWVFGWKRLPKGVHLAAIWLVALGSTASAYFILAANSWMQHPVGYRIEDGGTRARLTSIGALLGNSTAIVTMLHTIAACFLTAGSLMVTVCSYHLMRGRSGAVMRTSATLALWTVLIAGLGTAVTGDVQGKIMTDQQPMKMAAAEALYHTEQPASFSVFTIGSLDSRHEVYSIRVPRLLSFLATGSFDGRVDGIDNVQAQEVAAHGPGDYRPDIPLAYWSFRLMIGFGLLAMAIAAAGLLLRAWLRRRRGRDRVRDRDREAPRWFWRIALFALPLPLLGNSFGWIFTETARQPWVVYGLLKTAQGVSPTVPAGTVWTSLVVFTALYGVLAAINIGLMVRAAKAGPGEPPDTAVAAAEEPALAY
jgi:cytochrome bd ubiquinol oxidase subunit I